MKIYIGRVIAQHDFDQVVYEAAFMDEQKCEAALDHALNDAKQADPDWELSYIATVDILPLEG